MRKWLYALLDKNKSLKKSSKELYPSSHAIVGDFSRKNEIISESWILIDGLFILVKRKIKILEPLTWD